MTKDTVLSLLRSILIIVGSFLIGKNIFGAPATSDSVALWSGIIMTIGSTVWGIFDKSTTIDGVLSALRSIISAVGGYLVARGIINDNTVQAILALIAALIPAVQSQLGKSKALAISTGQISVMASGKTVNNPPTKND